MVTNGKKKREESAHYYVLVVNFHLFSIYNNLPLSIDIIKFRDSTPGPPEYKRTVFLVGMKCFALL
jgi:hypothetical protein